MAPFWKPGHHHTSQPGLRFSFPQEGTADLPHLAPPLSPPPTSPGPKHPRIRGGGRCCGRSHLPAGAPASTLLFCRRSPRGVPGHGRGRTPAEWTDLFSLRPVECRSGAGHPNRGSVRLHEATPRDKKFPELGFSNPDAVPHFNAGSTADGREYWDLAER